MNNDHHCGAFVLFVWVVVSVHILRTYSNGDASDDCFLDCKLESSKLNT